MSTPCIDKKEPESALFFIIFGGIGPSIHMW